MTDHAYRNAVKRKRELLKEIKEIDNFLDMYHHFSGTKEEETETDIELLPSIRRRARPDFIERSPLRKKRRGNPEVIADAAERIIRESGRPMVRSVLAEALEAGGIEIPSEDKARYVGTVLWRQSERFINLDKEGYWLRDTPNKEVGYDPRSVESTLEVIEKGLKSMSDEADLRRNS